jgi:hypothetical protein
MALSRPNVLPVWAEAGDKVAPSNGEIALGWMAGPTPPARQRFNWVLGWLMNGVRYLSRRGLGDYDPTETYMIGDRIIGDDGETYRSLVDNNTGHTPSTAAAFWGAWGSATAQTINFAAIHDYGPYVAAVTVGSGSPQFFVNESLAANAGGIDLATFGGPAIDLGGYV